MLPEILWLAIGVVAGFVMTFIFNRKKAKELNGYIEREKEMFSGRECCYDARNLNDNFECEHGFLIDTERFEKKFLKNDLKGLNAFYEDDWAIIRFHLELNDVDDLLKNSPRAIGRHTKIICEKIKCGETVRIPKGFIAGEKIMSITEHGKVEVYSKEEDRKVDHLLSGVNTTSSGEDSRSIDECLCLPNGRVVCSSSVGNLCGVHEPPGKIAVREYNRRSRKEDEDNSQPSNVPIYYDEEAKIYIWERLTPQEQKMISKEDVGEVVNIELEYIEKNGELDEKGIVFIQREAEKNGKNYSLLDIKKITNTENGYLEKIGAIKTEV